MTEPDPETVAFQAKTREAAFALVRAHLARAAAPYPGHEDEAEKRLALRADDLISEIAADPSLAALTMHNLCAMVLFALGDNPGDSYGERLSSLEARMVNREAEGWDGWESQRSPR
jgi:hypothetical protein